MTKIDHWIRLWLAAAALLGLGIAGSLWGVHEYRDWKIDRRVDVHLPVIREQAGAWGLPVPLVRSVVRAESGGNPSAVSPAGALGLMQVLPDTAEDVRGRFNLPEGDLHDPAYNVLIGTAYLRHLWDRFEGDPHLVIAAYHMGPTRVAGLLSEHEGITGPELVARHAGPKTRAYVKIVLSRAGV